MTPCEKLGYKVGDKFEVIIHTMSFKVGDVVKLVRDDGSESPLFEGGKGRRWFCNITRKVKPLPKLIKSKQWLADAIHNHGAGWPDGAKWAAQGGKTGTIAFAYGEKPRRIGKHWCTEQSEINTDVNIVDHKPQPNWHQTVLSRDEYFSVYPDVSTSCESETVVSQTPQPDTLDTLMKRWEDAKALVQQAHDAVAAELERRGWGEPTVLDITDWRDLKVGDVVEYVEGKLDYLVGLHVVVIGFDRNDDKRPVRCTHDSLNPDHECWPKQWKFIRRP